MSASFSVSIYERHVVAGVSLTAVGIGAPCVTRVAHTQRQAEIRLKAELRRILATSPVHELARFDVRRGLRVLKLRLELTLKGETRRKITGAFPLVVEPREIGERRLHVVYHPERPGEWFAAGRGRALDESTLAQEASLYFSSAWADLDDGDLADLRHEGRDRVRVLSFSAEPVSLLDQLQKQAGAFDDLILERDKGKRQRVLEQVGSDLTEAIAHDEGGWIGLPRSPYREDLLALCGSAPRRSVLLVGNTKVGKTTLVRHFAADLLEQGNYPLHRNLDKVTRVVQVTGRRLIAGMSHVGEWEARVTTLIEELKKGGAVLYVPDIAGFGRVGQARDSLRSMADVFRDPIARGEITVIGECTEAELQRLEDEAPAFAATFQRLHVKPTGVEESTRMLLARARMLERELGSTIEPWAHRALLDLSSMVYSAQALPGRAIELLERTARANPGKRIDDSAVVSQVATDTGLDWDMLSSDEALYERDVAASLARAVVGQEAAVAEMASLLVRIKGNMCDPGRPRGVFLFTGPTGTGKTELAKTLASTLYSHSDSHGERDASRFVRFDMSELSGPDAVARLIGDAWEPEGQLTSAGLAQPFAVYLFDEIEKAHRSVHALLLQLFDDGRLTDARGQTADFRQAVFIMTSNLGAAAKPALGLRESQDDPSFEIGRAVREFFAPELVNRIDAIVPFAPLSLDVSVQIAHKELARLFSRPGLVERSLFVRMDPSTVLAVAKHAFRSQDGARSLKRFLEDHIATELGDVIAQSPGTMQMLRIDGSPEALTVESTPLVEREPVAERFALEPLWKRPGEHLEQALSEGKAKLQALLADPRVQGLGETLRALLAQRDAAVHDVDGLRGYLAGLGERIERIERARERGEIELLEARFDEALKPREVLHQGRAIVDDLLHTIAELHILDRALDGQLIGHATTLEITPLSVGGTGARASASLLLTRMLEAFAAARGTLEEVEWVIEVGGSLERRQGRGRAALGKLGSPLMVAARFTGFGVHDYFAAETGSHVWHRGSQLPELIRVRALPDVAPSALAASFVQEDGARVLHPSALLPLVRQIRFQEPGRNRPPAPFELEDHSVGLFEARRARQLTEVLLPLWNLRASALRGQP